MSGGKLRKYASLLPHLSSNRISTVALIGGANSNQLLSATMVLREYAKRPVIFAKRTRFSGSNQQLLRLMVPPEDWHWVEAADWHRVEEIAAAYVEECASKGIRAMVLPEGACVPEALPGAMTLAEDVLRNMQEMGEDALEAVFIDAGTGLSAAALLLGLHERGFEETRVHVTLMADKPETFLAKYERYAVWYQVLRQRPLPDLRDRFVFHTPRIAPSYGSVNAQVLDVIRGYARRGILTDPVYSAKHLHTVERYLEEAEEPLAPSVVIHSGGTQSLLGYMHLFPEVNDQSS